MGIRKIMNFQENYSTINREERNLSAIFFLALCKHNNIYRFLDCFSSQKNIGSDFGIYFEYSFLRDLWNTINDNQIKKEIIRQYLIINNIDDILRNPIIEINRIFGVPTLTLSETKIVSPANWSMRYYNDHFRDDDDFLEVCRFKWSFRIKPDIVIHLDKFHAICIEEKLESMESWYPRGSDRKIFYSRGLPFVGQLELQKYMMEDLLGIETEFLLLTNRQKRINTHKIVSWKEIFNCLDLSDLPNFAKEVINRVCYNE